MTVMNIGRIANVVSTVKFTFKLNVQVYNVYEIIIIRLYVRIDYSSIFTFVEDVFFPLPIYLTIMVISKKKITFSYYVWCATASPRTTYNIQDLHAFILQEIITYRKFLTTQKLIIFKFYRQDRVCIYIYIGILKF